MISPNGRRFRPLALLLALLLALSGCDAAPVPPTAPTATSGAQATTPTPAAALATTPSPPAATTTAPAAAPAEPTAQAAAQVGKTLRVGSNLVTGWPENLDPQKLGNVGEFAVLQLNYEGLTRLDKNLATVPAAAERWTYNAEATAITFTLRADLHYSDGTPLVAQDFANAVHRALDPHSPGFGFTMLSMIMGAQAIIDTAIPTDAAKLDERFRQLGVRAVDDRTLTVQFAQPTAYFHTLAATPLFYPARRALIDAGGDAWYTKATNQIGNGPFQLTAIDQEKGLIAYTANSRYWQGRPKLDGVELHVIPEPAVALAAFKNGELDIITPDANDVAGIKADPALRAQYVENPGACTYSLSFNLTKAPFDNLQVRAAFAYAFDREGYARDAYQDTVLPTQTWIPDGYPGHDANETRFGFDPEKARQTLAAAGYPNGAGLPALTYTFPTDNTADRPRAEYLAQMYRRTLGVSITLQALESTALNALFGDVKTAPQMSEGGWCGGSADPHDWLSNVWHSRTFFASAFGYSNKDVDALLDAADRESDAAKRLARYAEAQRAIVGDVPAVMVRTAKNIFLVNRSVKGLALTPQDTIGGDVLGLLNVTIER